MSRLKVESLGVETLLNYLRTNAWMVPSFQRDFVWSEADVTNLVQSVIEARPIGMATLWEQPDDSGLALEPVSIEDTVAGSAAVAFLGDSREGRPAKFYAVLDGRQRCTALAMAFGGLRATDARRRFSGRYFLDVTQPDEADRVRYIKEADVRQRQLDRLSSSIAQGLFPLAVPEGETTFGLWMSYLQEIRDPKNYPGGVLPDADELERRDAVLKAAFNGINETVLAVYIVPEQYSLGDICEIFETLNTTGTRVSTVDLLHSWLYSDTSGDPEPVQLREWIDDLGQRPGAIGWASRKERPELIAQIVTACYLTLDSEKPAPRAVGRRKATQVTSMKAGDLLATPPEFWRSVIDSPDLIARYFGDFQLAIASRAFPLATSPYPVTLAIYTALRWYMDHDDRYASQWSRLELDAAFRAFFWRNALTGRYDQGFLTTSASDLRALKEILFRRGSFGGANSWATYANEALDRIIGRPLPTTEELSLRLMDSRPPGALGKAYSLPVLTRPATDLLDPNVSIEFPAEAGVELHHIFPRAWCKNNMHGDLKSVLDRDVAGMDHVASVANLAPLSAESNNWWRARTPGQALAEKGIDVTNAGGRLRDYYIGEEAFLRLTAATPDPLGFWRARADSLARDLLLRCSVDIHSS